MTSESNNLQVWVERASSYTLHQSEEETLTLKDCRQHDVCVTSNVSGTTDRTTCVRGFASQNNIHLRHVMKSRVSESSITARKMTVIDGVDHESGYVCLDEILPPFLTDICGRCFKYTRMNE